MTPHTCPSCNTKTGKGGHLCTPTREDDVQCSYCNALILSERHLCKDKVKELAYVCNTCGRTALKADYLCDPKEIE